MARLSDPPDFLELAEVNPPRFPDTTHVQLAGRWPHVVVTDNVFRQVRVSPYALAARITHDVPDVTPTITVSTRDRNILAIESEVRGAVGNGVHSFFVVQGDVLPEVDHLANAYEIVEHLRRLSDEFETIEVGMSCRSQRWMKERRTRAGAQFLVTGPVIDPATVGTVAERLALADGDPPMYLGVIPPFSSTWVERMVELGVVEPTREFTEQLAMLDPDTARAAAWSAVRTIGDAARGAGFAGSLLMGLRFETIVGEAFEALSVG
jgi:methylenetetrahydrofolate reductase (NADPH)